MVNFLSNLLGGKKGADKRPEERNVYSPVTGKLMRLEKVSDPVFAEGTMGGGCAVLPEEGELFAPVSGEVIALFPTGHALGVRSDDGMEVLIHIGVDTVEMKGNGFTPHVNINDRVEMGQSLVSFDIQRIRGCGYDPTVIVVVTNSSDFGDLQLNEEEEISHGARLFWFGRGKD